MGKRIIPEKESATFAESRLAAASAEGQAIKVKKKEISFTRVEQKYSGKFFKRYILMEEYCRLIPSGSQLQAEGYPL